MTLRAVAGVSAITSVLGWLLSPRGARAVSTMEACRRPPSRVDRHRTTWDRAYRAMRRVAGQRGQSTETAWAEVLERERRALVYALIGQIGDLQRLLSALPAEERATLKPATHQHFFVLVDVVAQLQSDLPRQSPGVNGATLP